MALNCNSVILGNLPLFFSQVLGRFNRARAARLTLPHHVCQTPLFMPVGTQGQRSNFILSVSLLQCEKNNFSTAFYSPS